MRETDQSKRLKEIDKQHIELLISQQTEESIKQLTSMSIKEELFNSDTHRWSEKDSEFAALLTNKSNVCIVIEDTNENIFGGLISQPLRPGKCIDDEKAFIFSIKRDSHFHPKKFFKQEKYHDFFLNKDTDPMLLFSFGCEIVGNGIVSKDIIVFKKGNPQKPCRSVQVAFNYQGEKHVLTGDKHFQVKRIIVYQLC